MNTPTFNLNLSFFDEKDNLPGESSSMNTNMNTQGRFDTTGENNSELNGKTVTKQGSSTDDVFISFFNEFPFLDELFTPFDGNDSEQDKPKDNESTKSTENQEETKNEEVDSRHNILDEEDLNDISAANSEKKTKYSTTWAKKPSKVRCI